MWPYQVESARHKERADFDRLVMTVQTNGTIEAWDAVVQAAKILQHQMAAITGEDLVAGTAVPVAPKRADLMTPIDSVKGLSPRTYQALKKENINFLGDLVASDRSQLEGTPKIGKKTLDEIKASLEELGLELGMEIDLAAGRELSDDDETPGCWSKIKPQQCAPPRHVPQYGQIAV